MNWKEKIRHAFAVDDRGPAQPTEQQQIPVDWISRQIAKRHLTTPALIVLEMCRPLNFITAQAMHMGEPAVWAVSPRAFLDHYRNLATFLEHRGSIEYISRRLEEIEARYSAAEENARTTSGKQSDVQSHAPTDENADDDDSSTG